MSFAHRPANTVAGFANKPVLRRLPPMHALAAFEVAARYLSFSRAADELCLTDSAVSHRIRQLEEHLGCRLFVRMSRQVALTAQGEAFLGPVRDCLRALEESSGRLRGTASGQRPRRHALDDAARAAPQAS